MRPAEMTAALHSIAPTLAASLVPLKAESRRSQAPCFFVYLINLIVEPRDFRFPHIGAAQFIENLANG
jgi:hypothetical protein